MRRHILATGIIAVFFISGSASLAAPPVLGVSPTYMEFDAYEGGANPDADILSIWRDGGNGPLNWDVTEGCDWLTVDPNSGTSLGEVDDCNVIVGINSLAAGVYNCQLTVDAGTAANSPQVVDVNLTVIGPTIGLSAIYFEFTATEDGATPNDQILNITNSGGGTLHWQIAKDCNWLSSEPNSGSSTGEVDDVNLSVDITGLTDGIYNCQLTVSDTNAANSPQIVDVNLFIYSLNPVSWWKFDEGSGGTAYDSASDNDGTIYGPNWTTGRINSALDFDGSNDYVEVLDPADKSLDFGAGNFTISLWFKTIDTEGELVDKSGGRYGRQTGYSIYMGTATALNDGEIGFRVSDGSNPDFIKTNNAYNDGNWHHLAAIRMGSGSANLDIYADGKNVPTTSLVNDGAGDISNSYDLSIGAKYDACDTDIWENFLDGTIDDVRIFDRALSAGEIQHFFEEDLAGRAFDPNPTDGKTQVDPNIILSWSPNPWASDVNGHDVYFGTDYNDVNDATTSSSEYIGRQDANSWDPCGLDLVTDYYWRIDEANGLNLWKGDIWSFRTATPLIELSATKFYFHGDWDGPNNPNDQILTIHNEGIGTLNWTVAKDCNWLTVDPNSGSSTGPGQPNDVALSVDITGLSEGVYDCNLIVSDPNADNSPQTVKVVLSPPGCFPADHPDYQEWKNVGEPNCWCYPRHCYGDTDNQIHGTPKFGYFWVGGYDLQLLFDNWQILEPPKGSGIVYLGEPNMCADVDHQAAGTAKMGYYRAGGGDLQIMFNNWQILQPPRSSGIPPDCLDVP